MVEKLNQKPAAVGIGDTDIFLLADPGTGKMYKVTSLQLKNYMKTGDLSALLTDDKSSLVAAINEVDNAVSNLGSDNVTLAIFKVSNYATL